MSRTSPSSRTDVVPGIAETAALLDERQDAPSICSAVIERAAAVPDAYRVELQLASGYYYAHDALSTLVQWAETFEAPTVTALRREEPVAHTSIAVRAEVDALFVKVWTHPDDEELAALWGQVGHTPEVATVVTLSLDVLRAAAEELARIETEVEDEDEVEVAGDGVA